MIYLIFQRGLLSGLVLLLVIIFLFSTKVYSKDLLQTSAVQQIVTIHQAKITRTAAQKKIDTRLLLEIKRLRNDPLLAALPLLQNQVDVKSNGNVEVDINAETSTGLLTLILESGGQIISQHSRFNAIRALIPLDKLEIVANFPAVRMIRPAERPQLNMINTSEGDVAHATNVARANFGVTGAGTKICALSDSVDSLAALQSSGDLPVAVDVLAGQSGNPGSSEGTAMLEIMHDLAPGAELGFATAFGGQAQMAQNILDLQASGCDVIVDDVFYFAEPTFQDGIIAQAVDTVTKAGALYFSSAGNSGNLNDGTSGVWEGTYVPTTLPALLAANGLSAHDFGGGNNTNAITGTAPSSVTLHWNDPLGASSNDYDLFRLDAGLNNVLAVSNAEQSGTQDPFEIIGPSPAGTHLVVVLFAGVPRFLHLNTLRGQLQFATNGQTAGHSAAKGAISVAAVNVATAGGGVFAGGVFNSVESFSSDGPRRIFFEPDGTPIPVEIRQKPNIAAADGVSTATPGFNPFFGTSAAAPHAAGISALLKVLFPAMSYQGFNALSSATALDIEAAGVDNDSGVGLFQAGLDEMIGDPNPEKSLKNVIFADGFESGNTSAWTN